MEGTRRGRESAKKYLRWVLGVDRETPSYLVREEWKRSRLRRKRERERPSLRTNGWKGRVQNTDRMLKKKNKEKKKRGTGMSMKMWKD
jgi:hypothetical protein